MSHGAVSLYTLQRPAAKTGSRSQAATMATSAEGAHRTTKCRRSPHRTLPWPPVAAALVAIAAKAGAYRSLPVMGTICEMAEAALLETIAIGLLGYEWRMFQEDIDDPRVIAARFLRKPVAGGTSVPADMSLPPEVFPDAINALLTDRNAVYAMECELERRGLYHDYIVDLNTMLLAQGRFPTVTEQAMAIKKAAPRLCCQAAALVIERSGEVAA